MKTDRSAVSANLHHNLILEDRSAMNLSGVTDVDCFDERTIRLYTQLGELVIKGKISILTRSAWKPVICEYPATSGRSSTATKTAKGHSPPSASCSADV